MAKVFGKTGSAKSLRDELEKRKISRFNSIGDINKFLAKYTWEKQNILKHHEDLLVEEIKELSTNIKEGEIKLEAAKKEERTKLNVRINIYTDKIHSLEERRVSFIGKVIVFYRLLRLKRKKASLQKNFDILISNAVRRIRKGMNRDSRRMNYLSENRQKIVLERSSAEINETDRVKKSLDELRPLIAGTIGESLVEKEIRKLSDDYTLINDFNMKFDPPIYKRDTGDRIFSIQLDHLLISKSGIFILETKNWSKNSINSLDLRSPVAQITRSSYALFVLVNHIQLNKHHWGKKKIPIKNVIVMIQGKPKEEFQYVTIKQLRELNRYIEYFEPIFSKEEVEKIADYLKYQCKKVLLRKA